MAAKSFRSSAISMLSGCVPMIGTPAAFKPSAGFVRHGHDALPAFGHLDAFWLRANDRHAGGLQARGQDERRLAAEVDDDAFGKLLLVNVKHVPELEGLKIGFVARVGIG